MSIGYIWGITLNPEESKRNPHTRHFYSLLTKVNARGMRYSSAWTGPALKLKHVQLRNRNTDCRKAMAYSYWSTQVTVSHTPIGFWITCKRK
jgi:hypothetical protein